LQVKIFFVEKNSTQFSRQKLFFKATAAVSGPPTTACTQKNFAKTKMRYEEKKPERGGGAPDTPARSPRILLSPLPGSLLLVHVSVYGFFSAWEMAPCQVALNTGFPLPALAFFASIAVASAEDISSIRRNRAFTLFRSSENNNHRQKNSIKTVTYRHYAVVPPAQKNCSLVFAAVRGGYPLASGAQRVSVRESKKFLFFAAPGDFSAVELSMKFR
jgi:hypothetical protein